MSSQIHDYPIKPIPFTQVEITDSFWQPRIHTAATVTVPYDFQQCEDTGRITNFDKAAGALPGAHEGIFYNDSDVFKVVEGAAYALLVAPDAALEDYVDALIAKFAAAQEADGYLYTARTIDPGAVDERCGAARWSNLAVNHELYNVGHMYEAAVAWYEATGKRNFLEVALKNAGLIDAVFGEDKLRDVPGHQQIELGLARLYRCTGDTKYLRLAKFFLDERGQAERREIYGAYCQDHLPVTQQREVVGHAVRAGYQYAAMTDIAAMCQAEEYARAVLTLWENMVSKKMALTGGVGARHEGEAFGDAYELPSLTAYNETCAAQASIYWNQRLFLLTGESKFIDVLERTLYNGFLSGVGMDGRSFFYVNPLACDGEFRFNREAHMTRRPWYGTACCPTNVARLLPALAGYVYAQRDDQLYVNLYAAGSAQLQLPSGAIRIKQRTRYPWDGRIDIDIFAEAATDFTVKLRIPGYALGQPVPSDLYASLDAETGTVELLVAGEAVPLRMEAGYATIARRWQGTTRLTLRLPMSARRMIAHAAVADLRGQVALERGPLVYALESADNPGRVLELGLADASPVQAEHRADLLGGTTTLRGQALDAAGATVDFTAIPYCVWGHRGDGQMTTWLKRI
ncbi:MAG: glycoside hydrolase family 127 protein [Chloroflexi bacterium]|nr:glycoside hydrolase family 127 protein [Chloroflexota bacterium]MCY3581124.1 glycoside hydrolase family 127 protein [Chloroflexota bacterium]MCY3715599.1 glycoside hydrolase family 127 protein [Chloroflexota bacterium]MDE2650663.1 glycoside hydrolase family 127 protein [Chloroflexota bacterium]MXV93987.1 glycoside hydrolase family 127 protein [Chloroflexota bacterium]